jgi:hypothetical protein
VAVLPQSKPGVRRRPSKRSPTLVIDPLGQGSGGGREIASMFKQHIGGKGGIGGLGLEGRSIRREDIEQMPARIVGGRADPRADLAGPPPVGDLPMLPNTCPPMGFQKSAPVGMDVEHIPWPMASCVLHHASGTPRDHPLGFDGGVEGACRLQETGALPDTDRGNGHQVAVEQLVGAMPWMAGGRRGRSDGVAALAPRLDDGFGGAIGAESLGELEVPCNTLAALVQMPAVARRLH